jgi:hypothetical protein
MPETREDSKSARCHDELRVELKDKQDLVMQSHLVCKQAEVLSKRVAHRGPDRTAIAQIGSCVMAHTRLAVVDAPTNLCENDHHVLPPDDALSPTGYVQHQPLLSSPGMRNNDGPCAPSMCLVVNGALT